ncbi:response regulator [Pseudoxanthomonas wuyuanensis]|uniref:Two-component system, OmpR family, KDP operon response regulator KdpE n=1 Tax=Pseudoxanthomonas wuyuanensis TaxID=1073196 RepID=A0A286D6M5_9GAMM|nr:response regulator transcription factor [Pseudoxanthomonas wuyuanensis]KAF1721465.1 DNA-binding response regulator [Pseudoxanthomonas wuyuanensis]SOD54277.1 two-component system, OmpR family, KDP operon response regulator KdpE [Pseudoxanthomonas wuyuanensis]
MNSTDPSTPSSVPPARVLVIDDEPQIRKFLDISLRAQGYQVTLAADGESGLVALASQGADLVVLDIGLPDKDGHEVLHEIRQWSQVPVIMLTVRAGEGEKVAALDAGVNDYVTKPFGVQELMARIRNLLRNHGGAPEQALPAFDDGHLRIDLVRRAVIRDGEPLALSRKEFALLSLLLRHAGRVVTQPQLLRELWGPTHQHDTHYLRILVGKLRQKLGDDATAPRYIATEPGVGLRFIPQP